MLNETDATKNPTMQPKETSDSSSLRNNMAMGVNNVIAGDSATSLVWERLLCTSRRHVGATRWNQNVIRTRINYMATRVCPRVATTFGCIWPHKCTCKINEKEHIQWTRKDSFDGLVGSFLFELSEFNLLPTSLNTQYPAALGNHPTVL